MLTTTLYICILYKVDKVLLCSTGNDMQYLVISYSEKEFFKKSVGASLAAQ